MGAPLNIVIVGGGTAGWMTAAGLSLACPPQLATITLIESDDIGTIGVGEASIPSIAHFNSLLRIDEREFMAKTRATFKLGIEFVGWGGEGQSYMHPFGSFGTNFDLAAFHHYWLRLKQMGEGGDILDYNLSAVLSRQGRFAPPSPDKNSPLSSVVYAYHFDAGLYARYLRSYAEARGARRLEGMITQVGQNSETGYIEGVTLKDGRVIAGDFFIDCSGFRGLLIEGALKAGFEDWSHLLPCDRAVAVPSENPAQLTPYTRATARKAGWQWRIPLQHRTGNGLVYSSSHMSDDEAAQTLLSSLEGKALADPRPIRFLTGRRKSAWVKNCAAVGLSAGFLEPLESTSIHLIQKGVSKLIQCLPRQATAGGAFAPHLMDHFNRETRHEYEDVRDFLMLHYKANARDGAFWRYCREQDISDRLKARMDLFRESGRIFTGETELFRDPSWLSVMLGQGIFPQDYDPLADRMTIDDIRQNLAHISRTYLRSAAQAPRHEDFLQQHFGKPNIATEIV
ncbi:tryptophan 7-halogenase [Asticcacaulis sp. SL142]|uniref:tryptophan halogenase family protein n=1 Tax=Asticcacaulis sp. SL142 TaxID=2995155 RepID=UPI00226D31E6|nr:tryptophan halogenase family protein [Asticcacaulis sp. SL142]WAC49850.1 tryptophan 7-halogenase [Asticcacaulis sp. SL142]